MKLSFKYKFILSFVTLEVLFISLIVFFNFNSLNNLSKTLINTNIQSSSRLFIELIKTPLIINDLATIDNSVDSLIKMKYVVAVRIKDTKNNLISDLNYGNPQYIKILDENIEKSEIDKKVYLLQTQSVFVYDEKLAEVQILYELSDVHNIIESNRNFTVLFILIEILISTLLAYFIGYKLTKRLSELTMTAKEISENNHVEIIEDKNIMDEISILNNTLHTMQNKIFERNNELKELITKLEYSSIQLKNERDFHNALINNTSSAIVILNKQYKIFKVNETVKKVTGYSDLELKDKFIWDIFKNKSIIKELMQNKSVLDYPKEYENILISKDETNILYGWSNSFTYNVFDEVEYIISVGVDISTIKEIQQKLEKYIKLVNENIIISRTNLDGKITDVSEAFCEISGFSREELVGQSHVIMRHEDTPIEVYENLWTTITEGKIWNSEVKNRTKSGGFYWTDSTIYPDYDINGKIIGYYAIRHDITNKKIIENLSITDPLTKLYNRRHFDSVFDKKIAQAKRDRVIFCLLSLDVDYFKLYNDTYGHQEGDIILQTISNILILNMKRPSDLVFRMGGEEFSAIFTVNEEKSVYEFSDNIRKSIENEKIEHLSNVISPYVTVSIGVSYINFKNDNNIENINCDKKFVYKYTDNLLYKAKNSGRNLVLTEELLG